MSCCPHETLWAMFAGPGWWEVVWQRERERVFGHRPALERDALLPTLCHGLEGLELMVPRSLPKPQSVAMPVAALWVQSASKASERLLSGFRVKPTLVLREGSTARLTVFWALSRALGHEWAVEANRRLAHFARAPKKHADPDTFTFRPAGSKVRLKRKVLEVEAVVCEPRLYRAREVVGHLPQSPDPEAWRDREAA